MDKEKEELKKEDAKVDQKVQDLEKEEKGGFPDKMDFKKFLGCGG